MGLVAPQNKELKWLLPDARVSNIADAGIPGGPADQPLPSQKPAQQSGKINVGDALKKLFK